MDIPFIASKIWLRAKILRRFSCNGRNRRRARAVRRRFGNENEVVLECCRWMGKLAPHPVFQVRVRGPRAERLDEQRQIEAGLKPSSSSYRGRFSPPCW